MQERFGVFARTVDLPWGMNGDSLILNEGGRPGERGTFCLPHTVLPKAQPGNSGPSAVAGSILRVCQGRQVGELRLTEMTGPDAADPPYPRCLLRHSAAERMVNYDLNWASVNFGTARAAAPAVHATITGADGAAMIAERPGANVNGCRVVRSFSLPSQSQGRQLGYGLTPRVPRHADPAELSVSVDGHRMKLHLSPVCSRRDCFQDDPPVTYTPGTPYSVWMKL